MMQVALTSIVILQTVQPMRSSLPYSLTVRNRSCMQIQEMRALLLSDEDRLIRPGLKGVRDGAVVVEAPTRQTRDKDGLGAERANLLHHERHVDPHGLGRRDLHVVVAKLDRGKGAPAFGDFALDGGH